MRITVAAVGKVRDAALAAAIREYESRAARYWPVRFVEVRAEPRRTLPPELVRAREGARLRAAVPTPVRYWLCDEDGVEYTSVGLARWLQRVREQARDIAVFIGGAYGHCATLRADAAGAIALSRLTLPHELARLVFVEQLYRAATIVRGEPYHKA